MASDKSPKNDSSVPSLRDLFARWDSHPGKTLFELVHRIHWQPGIVADAGKPSSSISFLGYLEGTKNVYAQFRTCGNETQRVLFRPGTMLEVWVKEQGEHWTRFVFKLHDERKRLGTVLVQIFSEFGEVSAFPAFGFPNPIEFGDMKNVIEQALDNASVRLFETPVGRMLAALTALEFAIVWEEARIDPLLTTLDQIGYEIIQEIRCNIDKKGSEAI